MILPHQLMIRINLYPNLLLLSAGVCRLKNSSASAVDIKSWSTCVSAKPSRLSRQYFLSYPLPPPENLLNFPIRSEQKIFIIEYPQPFSVIRIGFIVKYIHWLSLSADFQCFSFYSLYSDATPDLPELSPIREKLNLTRDSNYTETIKHKNPYPKS